MPTVQDSVTYYNSRVRINIGKTDTDPASGAAEPGTDLPGRRARNSQ